LVTDFAFFSENSFIVGIVRWFPGICFERYPLHQPAYRACALIRRSAEEVKRILITNLMTNFTPPRFRF